MHAGLHRFLCRFQRQAVSLNSVFMTGINRDRLQQVEESVSAWQMRTFLFKDGGKEKATWKLGTTKEVSNKLHIIPLMIEF